MSHIPSHRSDTPPLPRYRPSLHGRRSSGCACSLSPRSGYQIACRCSHSSSYFLRCRRFFPENSHSTYPGIPIRAANLNISSAAIHCVVVYTTLCGTNQTRHIRTSFISSPDDSGRIFRFAEPAAKTGSATGDSVHRESRIYSRHFSEQLKKECCIHASVLSQGITTIMFSFSSFIAIQADIRNPLRYL